MGKLGFYIVFVLLPLSCLSQNGTIKGQVLGEGGEPVCQAIIRTKTGSKTDTGVMADTNGNYILTGLKNKKYEIDVSGMGYKSSLMTDVVISDSTQVINFILKELFSSNPYRVKYNANLSKSSNLDSKCAINGQVTNNTQVPIKNAEVSAYWNDSLLIRTTTDMAGKYCMQLDCEGLIELRIFSKYNGKRRRKYYYPTCVIIDVPVKSGSTTKVDFTVPKNEYEIYTGPYHCP